LGCKNPGLSAVMAGLDPAIHVFAVPKKSDVDARVKPAHDELKVRLFGAHAPRNDGDDGAGALTQLDLVGNLV
jgi:hypothetical protein